MRFAAATIALLLAVASATPVPDVNEANLDREPESRTIVDLGFLQAHETRDVNIADGKKALRFQRLYKADIEKLSYPELLMMLKFRSSVVVFWPHDHQSGIFKAGNGYYKRIVTGLVINGVNVAVTAWFNDIHTLFLQFDAAFPNAPNFIFAGFEDVSTGVERSPWRISWDEIYSLAIKPGERFQFDNSFVMWWK
ncbi:hypothetical protein CTAM01_08883 [Colletotrichum tamarilloi]|uniref:Uncharacterized protein n=1 Tax=Colletotrichum tamarilloi TaxID=1209934 RepID=A0ABQ9R4G4_9PEZI|nr:uncharacterized protein CTAM01_08883 [Colletotrichum tamarilloi]KAK1494529.1 hypothetical protein CTAM01_08883 [Colletotrichum tamarilloi]